MTGLPAKFKVLVVEDEPLIGMDIEYAVEGLGHEVVGPIADLHTALKLAEDETLGCAILDVNIRGGNSYSVADMLLKRGVPLMFLSGYRMEILPKRLQDETRLSKPFTVDQLREELCNLHAKAMNSRNLDCAETG